MNKTITPSIETIERNWFLVDAKDKTLGRLSTEIAAVLRGKNKPTFTPHLDTGDFVIVVNAEKVEVTGKKASQKLYRRHSGRPGGIKEITPEKLKEKKPGESLKLAVKRMLPGGVLGKKQLTKLKIYEGNEHPHSAQNIKIIEIGKLNTKNIIRN